MTIHLRLALATAVALAGGCAEAGEGDPAPPPIAAIASTCRARTSVMVVANLSGQEIRRLRLVDPAGRTPDLELVIKQPRQAFRRYEVMWQQCGPESRLARNLLVDLTGEQRRHGPVTLDPGTPAWVFFTPEGSL